MSKKIKKELLDNIPEESESMREDSILMTNSKIGRGLMEHDQYKDSVVMEDRVGRKDSLIKRLNSLSDVHLKINFVISFIVLVFTAAVIFYIPMYKLESIVDSTTDYGHLSLWRFTEGSSDTTVWFIFWQ